MRKASCGLLKVPCGKWLVFPSGRGSLSYGKRLCFLWESGKYPSGSEGISGWKRKVFLRKEKESFFSNSRVGTVVVVREA